MDNIIDKLLTVGVGLALLAGTWFIWFISGVANNLFSNKKWSWKRMAEDAVKTLLMGIGILAWVLVAEILDWYTMQVGMDISQLLDGASITGLIAIICGGSGYYMAKAFRNFAAFIGTDHVAKKVGEAGYAAVAQPIKDFIETITTKTDKEHLEDEGARDSQLNGKELSNEEIGMGGFANTYPQPYNSAPQDSMTDPSTCYNRECVSYCAWKIKELTGSWPKRTGGMNAKYWVQRLAENGYTKVVDKPQNSGKYVGVTEKGEYGHVIWFEEDNIISEYNYSIRGGFSVRAIDTSAYKWVEIQAPNDATKTAQKATGAPKKTTTKKDTATAKKTASSVSYVYQQGDTFGQVIKKLGLATSHGLWGDDGDVKYYTDQLHRQGIYGNIGVGTKIILTPRK